MKAILLILIGAALTSCVRVSYYDPITGRKFDYSAPAFGTKNIKSIDLINGKLEGYTSEQSQIVDFARSMYEAGLSAGKKAVLP
jgi:hypothetical protein